MESGGVDELEVPGARCQYALNPAKDNAQPLLDERSSWHSSVDVPMRTEVNKTGRKLNGILIR